MQLILFHTKWNCLISVLISVLTLSKYSHAAIVINGAVYDAIDGDFSCIGRIEDIDISRKISLFDISHTVRHDINEEIEAMILNCKRFSYSTIKAYVKNSEGDIYCFKAVASILNKAGMSIEKTGRINAHTIMKCMKLHNKKKSFSGYPLDFKPRIGYN